MELIECKILDFNILVPCRPESTVAELTAAALAEYSTFNLKRKPQKILYTKDSKGRVLSGALKVSDVKSENVFDVVVAEYSDKDFVSPSETEKLYRDWQLWSVAQIKDYVQSLAVAAIPPTPEPQSLSLLYELADSKNESVQLACVRVLQSLLTKFPQQKLILDIAGRISSVFSKTPYAVVAIGALETFKGLSPLQFKVLDGKKYITRMLDVQNTLLRFSPESRGLLFAAFESLAAILEDDELAKVVEFSSKLSVAASLGDIDQDSHEDAEDEMGTSLGKILSESNPSAVAAAAQEGYSSPLGARGGAPPNTSRSAIASAAGRQPQPPSASKRKFNMSRFESLLLSVDPKVRLYSLEKLQRMLKTAYTSAAETRGVRGIKNSNVNSPAHISSKQQHQPEFAIDNTIASPNTPGSAAGVGSANSSGNDNGLTDCYLEKEKAGGAASDECFHFSSDVEVEALVKCLFRCLKASIHSRSQGGGSASGAGAAGPAPGPRIKPCEGNGGGISTAGRLIQAALRSPQTDTAAVNLALDCLWLIFHFPYDIRVSKSVHADLVPQVHNSILAFSRRVKHHKMNGAKLTNIQVIFACASIEWHRFILTLAHSSECMAPFGSGGSGSGSGGGASNNKQQTAGNNNDGCVNISEKCAFFFSVVVITGMPRGWADCSGASPKLEYEAVYSFTAMCSQPNYRCYVALSFLSYLAKILSKSSAQKQKPSAAVAPLPEASGRPPTSTASLENFLSRNDFVLLKILWRWAVSDSSNRMCRMLSLKCIAEVSMFANFNAELLKFDPIVKLLEMIVAHGDRNRRKERKAFGVDDYDVQQNHQNYLHAAALDSDGDEDSDDELRAVDFDEDNDDSTGENNDDDYEKGENGYSYAEDYDYDDDHNYGFSSTKQQRVAAAEGASDYDASRPSSGDKKRRCIPDFVVLRLSLKVISNLMSAMTPNPAFSVQISHFLSNVSIARDEAAGINGVRLKKLTEKDDMLKFYYDLISNGD